MSHHVIPSDFCSKTQFSHSKLVILRNLDCAQFLLKGEGPWSEEHELVRLWFLCLQSALKETVSTVQVVEPEEHAHVRVFLCPH